MRKEIWKDIPEYEGYYQCSNFGRVSSLYRIIKRVNGQTQPIKGRILKLSTDKKGYKTVELSKDGNRYTFKIHQLVAITFLGHSLCGMKTVIDHVDGYRDNNNLSNLRLVTVRENSSICYRKNKKLYSSQYVGVYWNKNNNKWHSRIRIGDRMKHLGYFTVEQDASNAYQLALLNL